MKKIESNRFGSKILLIGIVFAFIIPAILRAMPKEYEGFRIAATISTIIGVLIFLVFVVILTIELHQDKRRNHYFLTRQAIRRKIDDSYYECQSCGNRQVTKEEKTCTVCGIHFIDEEENK